MSKEVSNPVRQKRPPGYYTSDNELVDELAAEVGIYAFGVYHLLKRKAANWAGAPISRREIAEKLSISKDSAANAIATLKNAGLIEEELSEDPNAPSMFLVIEAKEVLEARKANPALCPEIRTRVVTKRVRNSGHPESVIQDATALNSGLRSPEFRTPNMEADKDKTLVPDTTPLAPKGGKACDPSREASRTARSAQKLPSEGKSQNAGMLRVSRMRKQADAELDAVVADADEREREPRQAVAKVMRECGLSNPRKWAPIVRAAMEMERSRSEPALAWGEIAERMVAASASWVESQHLMAYKIGIRRFFEELWHDDRKWPWDEKRLDEAKRAMVGRRYG